MQYQEQEDLASYLDAMFGYYEAEGKASGDHGVDKAASVTAPTAIVQYRSMFETILAKFGLDLSDATFNEIIKGDYYAVLKRHRLVDMMPVNNAEYQSLGGIGS